MKTWSPQMIGVAAPLPGIRTFHFTLLVSLQVEGGFPEGAVPVASGPRHCGQFWSAEDEAPCAAPTENNKASAAFRHAGWTILFKLQKRAFIFSPRFMGASLPQLMLPEQAGAITAGGLILFLDRLDGAGPAQPGRLAQVNLGLASS